MKKFSLLMVAGLLAQFAATSAFADPTSKVHTGSVEELQCECGTTRNQAKIFDETKSSQDDANKTVVVGK